jgi:hypothetical protein
MTYLLPALVALLLIALVLRARRRRKARSAVGADGFAPFVTMTTDLGRDRHRAPTGRLTRGSRGRM